MFTDFEKEPSNVSLNVYLFVRIKVFKDLTSVGQDAFKFTSAL